MKRGLPNPLLENLTIEQEAPGFKTLGLPASPRSSLGGYGNAFFQERVLYFTWLARGAEDVALGVRGNVRRSAIVHPICSLTGRQMTTGSPIGRALPRIDSDGKVKGAIKYVADAGKPGQLWGRVLRSPLPHARIVSVDTEEARKVAGVRAVLTAADVSSTLVGRTLRDMPILARDRVRFIGEKVAAVAADTLDAAEEALAAIKVTYDDLPSVTDPVEAMGDGAPLLHPDLPTYVGMPKPGEQLHSFIAGHPEPLGELSNVFSHSSWGKGEVEQGFAAADRIFEHTFATQWVHQAYLEPYACIVDIDDNGLIHVWANNKSPFLLRQYVAEGIGLPQDQLLVHPMPIGGDFGGKGSFMDVPIAFYLAKATGQPVGMAMNYMEEFMAGTPRHPAVITVKSGVTNDGDLLATKATIVLNSGAYAAMKPGINLPALKDAAGVYKTPNVRIDSFGVYTNAVPGGYFRGPGQAQVTFAVESHIDMICHDLNIDPLAFRLRNVIEEGDTSPTGEAWHDIHGAETLRRVGREIDWDGPKRGTHIGRGVSLSVKEALGGPSSALVSITNNGGVRVLTPVPDTGTGFHLILRQMVSEVLTVPVEDIEVAAGDTNTMGFDFGSSGSRVTNVAGKVAVDAAEELRQRIVTWGAEYLGCEEQAVRIKNATIAGGGRTVTFAEFKEAAPEEVTSVFSQSSVSPSTVPAFSAYGAEVAVDKETGQIDVRKVVVAPLTTTVINPVTHQGQINGAFVQGLGYALMEELKSEDGRISTLSFADYKIPNIMDLPTLVTALVSGSKSTGPFNSHPISESGLAGVAPAIANAIYDAVGARILDLPLTAEKVHRALKQTR